MASGSLIGKKLGDYTILEVLGQGGMAQVFKGYDETLARYAAVKVITSGMAPTEDEAEYRERFLREARSIAKLNHPRIVGVYQFGKAEDLFYMAMGFVEGRDLRQVLKEYARRGKRMSSTQVLRIIRDIAEALDYAHRNGVIHRDIKPSNIMVTADGHAVLTDFGLALNAQEGTIGNTFGSVHYIAPEQAVSSAQASAQSDLYSLGVVLYEVLVGRVPFDDASAMSVALKHISDPPPPPRDINPMISPEVEAIILKVLDKEPRRRFNHGMEFVKALESAFASSVDEDTHDLDTRSSIEAPLSPTSMKNSGPLSTRNTARTKQDAIGTPMTETRATSPAAPAPTPPRTRDSVTDGVQAVPSERSRRPLIIGGIVLALVIIGIIGAIVLSSGKDNNVSLTPTNVVEQGTPGIGGAGDDPTAEATEQSATQEVVVEATSTEVAATDQPATQEVVVAETDAPAITDVPTDIPATDVPTDAPTEIPPTETTAPTETPVPATATNTEEPTLAPTPTIDSAVTPGLEAASGEPQVLLRYNGDSLVLYNRDPSSPINVNNLDFVSVNAAGRETRYSSTEWRAADDDLNGLLPERCFQLWSTAFRSMAADEFPAEICETREGFGQTSRTFWIGEAGATFEVRRSGSVMGTCPVVAAGSDEEIRCVVDVR